MVLGIWVLGGNRLTELTLYFPQLSTMSILCHAVLLPTSRHEDGAYCSLLPFLQRFLMDNHLCYMQISASASLHLHLKSHAGQLEQS